MAAHAATITAGCGGAEQSSARTRRPDPPHGPVVGRILRLLDRGAEGRGQALDHVVDASIARCSVAVLCVVNLVALGIGWFRLNLRLRLRRPCLEGGRDGDGGRRGRHGGACSGDPAERVHHAAIVLTGLSHAGPSVAALAARTVASEAEARLDQVEHGIEGRVVEADLTGLRRPLKSDRVALVGGIRGHFRPNQIGATKALASFSLSKVMLTRSRLPGLT